MGFYVAAFQSVQSRTCKGCVGGSFLISEPQPQWSVLQNSSPGFLIPTFLVVAEEESFLEAQPDTCFLASNTFCFVLQ